MNIFNREIYFHEDDYCQAEILPIGAWDHCQEQLKEIDEFSNAHESPDGMGWTDIYVRSEGPTELNKINLSISSFKKTFEGQLKCFKKVYTGYSTYKDRCNNTICYGYNESCAVFADWNREQMVKHVWTSLFSSDQNELTTVINGIHSLGKRYDLLYVDWAWGLLIPIDGSKKLFESVFEKVTEISKRLKGMG
jgi:hypothetical protein